MGASLSYAHLTESCFAERIGERGLSHVAFAAELDASVTILEWLEGERRSRALPLLALPDLRDDLDVISAAVEALRQRFPRFALIGAGGSSLGGQCLADLAGAGPAAALTFLDGLDGRTLAELLTLADVAETGFVVISKSGGTVEPLAQLLVAIRACEEARIGPLAERFLVVAEPGDNPLRRLAERFDFTVLDHDPGVGGRYSVLSVVGAVPALLLGLDPAALRAGAAAALTRNLESGEEAPAAVGAAIAVGLARERGIDTSVVMAYADGLRRFSAWYCQLWAESLGKDGHGTTPVQARGPADQHSLLQLFLDGPANKLFTLITVESAGLGPRIPSDLAETAGLGYLADHTIGDIVAAQARATAETLAARGRPMRLLSVPRLDEHGLGALFMHFMLETIIAAGLLGLDPFDQPAVEEGKVLTRRYLEAGT